MYKDEVAVDQTATHFQTDGIIALIGSDEARPEENNENKNEEDGQQENSNNTSAQNNNSVVNARKNQFNYNDRMSQVLIFRLN